MNNHFCYILRNNYENDKNRTYNGYTVDPKHRIRQHNQEIKGGAIYTKKYGNKTWEMYVLIKGFPSHQNALQCEWRIKHPVKKKIRPAKYNSPDGRVKSLNEVFKLERWTSKSIESIEELQLEMWIIQEYADLLIDIPKNITVHIVDKIDLNLM